MMCFHCQSLPLLNKHSHAERGHCCGLCMATGQQPKHCNDSEKTEETEGGWGVR